MSLSHIQSSPLTQTPVPQLPICHTIIFIIIVTNLRFSIVMFIITFYLVIINIIIIASHHFYQRCHHMSHTAVYDKKFKVFYSHPSYWSLPTVGVVPFSLYLSRWNVNQAPNGTCLSTRLMPTWSIHSSMGEEQLRRRLFYCRWNCRHSHCVSCLIFVLILAPSSRP